MIQQLDPATSLGTPQDSGVSIPSAPAISLSQTTSPTLASPLGDAAVPVASSMDALMEQASQPAGLAVPPPAPVGLGAEPAALPTDTIAVDGGSPLKPLDIPAVSSLDGLAAVGTVTPDAPEVQPVAKASLTETATISPEAARGSTLIEILMANGNLTQTQLDQIKLQQAQTGKSLEQLVEENHLVSEVLLTKARSTLYKIPFVDLSEIGISPEALTHLPESVAQRYSILPFALNKQDGTLMVAMKDPLDLTAIDFAAQKSGLRIVPHYALPSQVDQTLSERYAQSLSSEVTEALKEAPQVAEARVHEKDLAVLSGEVVRQAPITKIVETILAFAVQARASDVHIEPQEARTRVRYRIDGILTEKLILPKSVHEAVVSRIKILSSLKIDEKRIPQDGRFNFTTGGENVDLRVSTLPTIHGEKIVMRLLKKDITVPTLVELGLDGHDLQLVEEVIKIPRGIVLVVGPTGSGKTTTLYSVLHKVNSPKVNIVTLEDPVEYEMPGINQVQINPQAGLTFASGLRSFLRQDPNIIMVGEIRDSETVELAIQASLTGHLVFSTLHTSSAAGAIPRLLDMGAERFLLASSITLAIGQRIVRKLNEEFKEEYDPDPAVVEDIKKVLGPRFDSWCQQNGKDPNHVKLYRSRMDRPGAEPEYKGRIGIFEVLRVTEEISRMIFDRATALDLEKAATKAGMILMKQDGYLKVLAGLTTIEEVLRVAEV
jgi:type IV pilus assembly protein PilB